MSSWQATQRYGIRVAPGGLALVQDLHNTRSIGGHAPDLLDDVATRARWFEQASARWGKEHGAQAATAKLEDRDLPRLRRLRDTVSSLLRGDGAWALDVKTRLVSNTEGRIDFAPTGRAIEWLESAIAAEVFTSQLDDSWPRLKLCRNPVCASAFYDTSRNNSGVWHDVHVCGNRFNLRAARERKKTP